MLAAIPSGGVAFAFHSFSGCKEHECECTCADTCAYTLSSLAALCYRNQRHWFLCHKPRLVRIVLVEQQFQSYSLCWAPSTGSKPRAGVHPTLPSMFYTDPVPPLTPPSKGISGLRNFWAEARGDLISVVWEIMQLAFHFGWTSGEIQTFTYSSYNIGTCLNQLTQRLEVECPPWVQGRNTNHLVLEGICCSWAQGNTRHRDTTAAPALSPVKVPNYLYSSFSPSWESQIFFQGRIAGIRHPPLKQGSCTWSVRFACAVKDFGFSSHIRMGKNSATTAFHLHIFNLISMWAQRARRRAMEQPQPQGGGGEILLAHSIFRALHAFHVTLLRKICCSC